MSPTTQLVAEAITIAQVGAKQGIPPPRPPPIPSSNWRIMGASVPSNSPGGFSVREVSSVHAVPHADGTLEVLELKMRPAGDTGSNTAALRGGWRSNSRPTSSNGGAGGKQGRSHWWDEKTLRVWLPPGFSLAGAPAGGWPVLIMCDGKNMFEDILAHQVKTRCFRRCELVLVHCPSACAPKFVPPTLMPPLLFLCALCDCWCRV
jgi:hypothetical protein